MRDDDVQLLESLAEAEHADWSRWMLYLFGQCTRNPDGSLTVPRELVEKCRRQLETPYAELVEEEKEADRDEVRQSLPIISAAIRRARASAGRI